MEAVRRTKIHVRELMSGPVVSASPEDNAAEVARRMSESKVGSVVILEDERPIGIITDGDLVQKVVAKNARPSSVKARDIMSQPVHMIEGEMEILEAAKTLRKLGIKRLGVSNRGSLVGIVSISDIVSVTPDLMEVLSEKSRILRGEPQRRGAYVSGYCDSCNTWSDFLTESDGRFLCEECLTDVRREE